jgi:hypothetical protein
MTAHDTDPPADVPDEVVTALDESSDEQLRAVVHYAQRLLRKEPTESDEIEPREGEEIVRTEDHGAYTYVVVEHPDETGEARGPFAYRVKWEPDMNDSGKYRWHYLGRAEDDPGA